MQLSKKPKIFCYFFIVFLVSTFKFEHFEEKLNLKNQIFLKSLTPRDVVTERRNRSCFSFSSFKNIGI